LITAAVVEFKTDKTNAVFIELTTTLTLPRQYRPFGWGWNKRSVGYELTARQVGRRNVIEETATIKASNRRLNETADIEKSVPGVAPPATQ
jgi:hypothetical protein